jgi:hypothetical protein
MAADQRTTAEGWHDASQQGQGQGWPLCMCRLREAQHITQLLTLHFQNIHTGRPNGLQLHPFAVRQ